MKFFKFSCTHCMCGDLQLLLDMLEKKIRNLLYFSFFEIFCFFPFIFCFNVLSTHMTLNVHFLSHLNGISMNCSVLCVQMIYFSLKFHKHVKFLSTVKTMYYKNFHFIKVTMKSET